MAQPYKVAVIGRTGRGNYGHGLDVVWKDIDRAQIVAVADEDETGRARAAERLGAPRSYADYREMLDRERPQIVSVAPRWTDCHRDMVVACAEFGCHVFMEKPMARTLQEADEMIRACEQAHVKLAIAHQTRYSPTLPVIRDLIGSGGLGDLLEIRTRGKEDHRAGGEDLMVLGTHLMDLMRYFRGDARWCFAGVTDAGVPVRKRHVRKATEDLGPIAGDSIEAIYGFDGPLLGYFASRPARSGVGSRFGIWFYGSRGIVSLTTGSLPDAWFIEDPSWRPGRSGAEWVRITSAGVGREETIQDQGHNLGNIWIVQDLIRAIETDGQPLGSMYDGRAALEMILAVYESHRIQAPVPLPLSHRGHPLDLLI